MTTYRLSGVVTDDDGITTVVDEFTTNTIRNEAALRFYTSSNFSGWLLLVRTALDGTKASQHFDLPGGHVTNQDK